MKKRRQQQPPPYLDGRVAGNSVSMRRSMRTSAGRFMQFFLCVVMLMAFSVQKASAYDDWKNEWNWEKFNPADGTLDLYIRIFQTWGGGNINGHCGFCTSSGNLTVKVAGYELEIDGEDNFKDDSKGHVNSTPKLPSGCVKWLGKHSGNAYYVLVNLDKISEL